MAFQGAVNNPCCAKRANEAVGHVIIGLLPKKTVDVSDTV